MGDGIGPVYLANGGTSGGCIQGTDNPSGLLWYYKAPYYFKGNKSTSLFQNLRYDVQTTIPGDKEEDVLLYGNGLAIYYDAPVTVGSSWTHIDVPLDNTGWRYEINKSPVTLADFSSVLSDIDSLLILGEFSGGADVGKLDNVILEPNNTAGALPLPVCAGTPINIITVDMMQADNYLWTLPGSVTGSSTDMNPSGIIYSAGGTYTATLILSNNCMSDTVVIPNIHILNPVQTSLAFEICAGDSVELPDGSFTSDAGQSTFTLTAANGCDSIISTKVIVHPNIYLSASSYLCYQEVLTLPWGETTDTAGVYRHTFQTIFGCDSVVTRYVFTNDELTSSADISNVSCYGAGDGSVKLSAAESYPPYSYSINGKMNTDGEFDLLTSGNYNYTVTDSNGCTTSGMFTITEPEPIALSVSPAVGYLRPPESILLHATCNYTDATYSWSPDDFLDCDNCNNVISTPDETIIYTVEASIVVDGHVCTETTNDTVIVLPSVFIPNAFTPDTDGLNEIFSGKISSLNNYSMDVFNRWGENVYHSEDINAGWNGEYKGEPAAEGTYAYLISGEIMKGKKYQYKGLVTLVR